jgi:hypothetical protein
MLMLLLPLLLTSADAISLHTCACAMHDGREAGRKEASSPPSPSPSPSTPPKALEEMKRKLS